MCLAVILMAMLIPPVYSAKVLFRFEAFRQLEDGHCHHRNGVARENIGCRHSHYSYRLIDWFVLLLLCSMRDLARERGNCRYMAKVEEQPRRSASDQL
jgi:hypothetical protein